DAVFILHPDGEHQIEPGAYLSVCYNGDCRQNQIYVPQLIQHARDHSMTILGPMLELLWIDVHATMYEQEQVTELQLKVGETSPT
ncbi:MAG: MerR family transcriptional regulator, partial [Enterocloster citroniae]|nr:MerR family transcriptional regulator [Enterocloster citroniae]